MNRAIARIASDNLLRQLLLGLVGLLILTATSDTWLRVLGGLLVATAAVLAGAELLSRSQGSRHRTEEPPCA